MLETFTGFILMMFMSGDPENKPTEFTPRDSLSHCLSTKRKVLRSQGSGGPQWMCKEGSVQLKEFNGEMLPVELINVED